MEILVHGRNVEVDPEIEAASRRKIERLPRLASDIRRVELEFSEIKNPRVADDQCCEMVVHLTKNFVKAHAVAADPRTGPRSGRGQGRAPAQQGPRQAGDPPPTLTSTAA